MKEQTLSDHLERFIFGIALVLVIAVTSALASPILNPGNGHYYEVILQPAITWTEANDAATALTGDWYLATITDANENAFVESLLVAGDSAYFANCITGTLAGTICSGLWIGGVSSSNTSNDWQWGTGEAFSFTDWGPYEPFPNGNHIRIEEFRSNGVLAWNDVPDHYTNGTGYIIESDYVPNLGVDTKFVNVSTRGFVSTGSGVLIAGFVVVGENPQKILVRGIGPELASLGVGGVLEDPILTVNSGFNAIATGDDWGDEVNVAEIVDANTNVAGSPLEDGSASAAVLVVLEPGPYTAIVRGKDGATGVALVEVFEVD
jgi:hypothetical protein